MALQQEILAPFTFLLIEFLHCILGWWLWHDIGLAHTPPSATFPVVHLACNFRLILQSLLSTLKDQNKP